MIRFDLRSRRAQNMTGNEFFHRGHRHTPTTTLFPFTSSVSFGASGNAVIVLTDPTTGTLTVGSHIQIFGGGGAVGPFFQGLRGCVLSETRGIISGGYQSGLPASWSYTAFSYQINGLSYSQEPGNLAWSRTSGFSGSPDVGALPVWLEGITSTRAIAILNNGVSSVNDYATTPTAAEVLHFTPGETPSRSGRADILPGTAGPPMKSVRLRDNYMMFVGYYAATNQCIAQVVGATPAGNILWGSPVNLGPMLTDAGNLSIPPRPDIFKIGGITPPDPGPPPVQPVVEGNIDLYNRPIIRHADGSMDTLRPITISENQFWVMIPTVMDNATIVSNQEAIDHYHNTGKHLGKFRSIIDANRYADWLALQQAFIYEEGSEERFLVSIPHSPIQFRVLNVVDRVNIQVLNSYTLPGALPAAYIPTFAITDQDWVLGAGFNIGSLGNTSVNYYFVAAARFANPGDRTSALISEPTAVVAPLNSPQIHEIHHLGGERIMITRDGKSSGTPMWEVYDVSVDPIFYVGAVYSDTRTHTVTF